MNLGQIHAHMDVVGSDGQHVGTVDQVEGPSIKLTKDNEQANGEHHWIPVELIDDIESTIRLKVSANDAMQQWLSERPAETLPDNQVTETARTDGDSFAADRE